MVGADLLVYKHHPQGITGTGPYPSRGNRRKPDFRRDELAEGIGGGEGGLSRRISRP